MEKLVQIPKVPQLNIIAACLLSINTYPFLHFFGSSDFSKSVNPNSPVYALLLRILLGFVWILSLFCNPPQFLP
jgi:hypothetical protein